VTAHPVITHLTDKAPRINRSETGVPSGVSTDHLRVRRRGELEERLMNTRGPFRQRHSSSCRNSTQSPHYTARLDSCSQVQKRNRRSRRVHRALSDQATTRRAPFDEGSQYTSRSDGGHREIKRAESSESQSEAARLGDAVRAAVMREGAARESPPLQLSAARREPRQSETPGYSRQSESVNRM